MYICESYIKIKCFMKSFRLSFFVLLVSALFFTSCDNEPLDIGLDTGSPDLGKGMISFKVNGEYKEYYAVASYVDQSMNGIEFKGWQIIAFEEDDSEELKFTIQLFPAELDKGTFDLYSDNQNIETINVIKYFTTVNEDGVDKERIYTSLSGKVEITNVNTKSKTMSGKFNAKVKELYNENDMLEITDGKINNIIYVDNDIN